MRSLLILMSVLVCFAAANEPPCEVFNDETEKCDRYAPPYENLNPEWNEFFVWDEPLDGELVEVTIKI